MERPRHCARPACAAPAVASLSFDYVARVAWLDDLGVDDEPSSYDLCALHAERLRVPRGWAREDRRGPVSPFRVPPLERLGEPVAV